MPMQLNQYFGRMVKIISSEGGDIFKFAGDALIVLWPESEDLQAVCRRAAQCALQFQTELHQAKVKTITLLPRVRGYCLCKMKRYGVFAIFQFLCFCLVCSCCGRSATACKYSLVNFNGDPFPLW